MRSTHPRESVTRHNHCAIAWRVTRRFVAHRVRRGIGAALGVLGRADAVVLMGGIGEHAAHMRERILSGMAGIGLELDPAANRACVGREGTISAPGSPISILVVVTQEERLIARETARLLGAAN